MPRNTTGLTLQAMHRKTKLAFGGKGAYAVESLESGQFSMEEIRSEYRRLRDIMRKRTQRLEASTEFRHEEYEDIPVSLRYESYPALSQLGSDRDVIEKLRNLAQAIESPLSTITGLQQVRERSLQSLYEDYPEMGEIVTEENFREFGRFMDHVRQVNKNRRFYNDEEILALFGEHVKKQTDFDSLKAAFDAWHDQQAAMVNKIPEARRR